MIIMFRKHPAFLIWSIKRTHHLVLVSIVAQLLRQTFVTRHVCGKSKQQHQSRCAIFYQTKCLSTYIHHNYHFRSVCNDSFYFWSNFLCMSSKIRCWCTFRIRLDKACILVAFYHHNSPLDSYSSISLRMKSVRFGMLCIAFPMNHCTSDTMNDMMHNYTAPDRLSIDRKINGRNKQIEFG